MTYVIRRNSRPTLFVKGFVVCTINTILIIGRLSPEYSVSAIGAVSGIAGRYRTIALKVDYHPPEFELLTVNSALSEVRFLGCSPRLSAANQLHPGCLYTVLLYEYCL